MMRLFHSARKKCVVITKIFAPAEKIRITESNTILTSFYYNNIVANIENKSGII